MTPAQRFLCAILEACDEIRGHDLEPESWARFEKSCAEAHIIFDAERVLSNLP